ncbi:hypothetical protein HPO_05235 [Hyphomonas polymorpha PS728]|uniref:PepSY domain-containing protein n=2 Tax=Hyphomonas polymorpha TaxID=74319 RepID=A0A062VJI2_9PROT|nr:hypothetical protein HPO_05235 [Hyphomonas polymorpha PS728]
MKALMTSLALLALAAPAPIALADDEYGLRGGGGTGGVTISREEAVRIARAEGMTRVKEIERDDGKWELEGCTRNGREIEIDIHGRTGAVLDLEIDEDDDC